MKQWFNSLPDWLNYTLPIIVGAALYAIGYEVTKWAIDEIREWRSRGKRRGRLNLTGDWYAAWRTTAEGVENINTELVKITQRGSKLTIENVAPSPENPRGGYLWRAECRLYDNEQLLGTYLPKTANVTAKGVMYFVVGKLGDTMVGGWVGCNLDSQLTFGDGAIGKEKERAVNLLGKPAPAKLTNKQEGDRKK